MNKNGFTLVELLGAIVILSLLITITTVSIKSQTNKAYTTLSETQVSLIESLTQKWVEDNIDNFPEIEENGCRYITFKTLKDYGLTDDVNENIEDISDTTKITICKIDNHYEYEVGYTGNAYSKLFICEYVSGTKGSIGAKYSCQVNKTDTFNFYLVSYRNYSFVATSNATVVTAYNLIMESNICEDGTAYYPIETYDNNCTCAVKWYDEEDNSNGPVTAMTYLYNATKYWDYIPNITVDYSDIDGVNKYDGMYTTGDITTIKSKNNTNNEIISFNNLKARMLYVKETSNNRFLYYNLQSQAKNHIVGYWLMNSYDFKTNNSNVLCAKTTHINSTGGYGITFRMVNTNIDHNSGCDGVRPVISVSKDLIKE